MSVRRQHERQDSIVAGGRRRAAEANLDAIKATVRARYAQEVAPDGFLRRLYLRVRIWREIRRKLEKVAPKAGVYVQK